MKMLKEIILMIMRQMEELKLMPLIEEKAELELNQKIRRKFIQSRINLILEKKPLKSRKQMMLTNTR